MGAEIFTAVFCIVMCSIPLGITWLEIVESHPALWGSERWVRSELSVFRQERWSAFQREHGTRLSENYGSYGYSKWDCKTGEWVHIAGSEDLFSRGSPATTGVKV